MGNTNLERPVRQGWGERKWVKVRSNRGSLQIRTHFYKL